MPYLITSNQKHQKSYFNDLPQLVQDFEPSLIESGAFKLR